MLEIKIRPRRAFARRRCRSVPYALPEAANGQAARDGLRRPPTAHGFRFGARPAVMDHDAKRCKGNTNDGAEHAFQTWLASDNFKRPVRPIRRHGGKRRWPDTPGRLI